jgi:hypothetical protein
MIRTLFYLMVAHALCDFPLQGDFLAKGKSKHTAFPGMPWWWLMAMHCLIHAGAVALVTGNIWLGLAEFVAHFIIDVVKCESVTSFKDDQLLHVACKFLWSILA